MVDNSLQSETAKQTLQNTIVSSISPAVPLNTTDEINILEYIYVLVKNKWWIIGAAILGLVLGYGMAILKGPKYVTEAVIAAKESDNKSTPNLSGLGALGGLVASQLNIGGNPGLDKIDLILGSKKFNAEMIEKYDLLPLMFKVQYPKVYKIEYDTVGKVWKNSFTKPNLLAMGSLLSKKYLKKDMASNGTMTIKVESKDSTFSEIVLKDYLEYLNEYVQYSVKKDADDNLAYLENRLEVIMDPLLREKLQGMIANEVEKAMLVSKEAFKIIDPPLKTENFKEKLMYPVVFSGGLFFMSTFVILLTSAIKSVSTNKRDAELMRKIKRELFIGQ